MGIDDLIVLAKNRGIDTIAITDHDCQAGNVRGRIIGERRGVAVLPGVELSAYDSARGRRADLLCYLSESPDRLEGLCHKNMLARKRANQYMMLKVAQRYPISPELVVKCASGSTGIFQQHIMHALLECGLTETVYSVLFETLFSPKAENNVFIEAKFPEPTEVLAAIHDSGGIAVFPHFQPQQDLEIVEELRTFGLNGLEVWHPKNTEEQSALAQEIAEKYDLLMTGGSNFHGMYGQEAVCVGDYLTPEEQLKTLLNYKTQLKKIGKKSV